MLPSASPGPRAASRILPTSGASAEAWAEAIDRWRAARNPVALQHLIEELPLPGSEGAGLGARERYRLLARGAAALASLGGEGRPALADLCASGDRFVRLAALNAAFVVSDAADRGRLIATALADPDPLIVAKGRALAEARR